MMSTNEKEKTNEKPLSENERAAVERTFNAIVNEMKKHGLPDVGLLKRAFELADEQHAGTRRKTGEPYIMHPLQVAKILADCGHESDMVAAALLHDVIEDCNVDKHDLEMTFGINIADIVDAVTKVSAFMAPEENMSKLDLDAMSDIKFLTESAKVKKAVYIKCADRIHNLRTISIFPEEQQREKAYHTRNIIIPAAKKLHIHNLVDILSTLCFQIENPGKYKEIKSVYERVLRENRDTFYGPFGLIEETKRMIMEDGRLGPNMAGVEFVKRTVDSLREELIGKLHTAFDVEKIFTKENAELFDIYFITSDLYMKKPENLFFACYDRLHTSSFEFTITGFHQDDYENYYIMKDWRGNMYRLFIQSETEYMEFTHGVLVSTEINDFNRGLGYVNKGEPGAPEEKMIPVFKKDGSSMMIANGSTVLDFAFAIDPNIGICAKYAFLNGSKTQTPISTRLKAGDMIEVVADHDKNDQANDTTHATVRWFEYLHTREAIKNLSRWLETHMDAAVPIMPVYDEKGQKYEIDMAATVLDFAFLLDEQAGLHVKKAYINKSHTPAKLDTTLRYGDTVRLEYDPDDTETPVFTWLGIVKTKYAKDRLITYFNKKFNMQ